MVEAGELTEIEAASHPRRSVLLRAVGAGADVEPDLARHAIRAGDRVLLTTDGLHTVVDADTIALELRTAATPAEAVAQLIERAQAVGAPDNIAVAVADTVAGRPPEGGTRRRARPRR
ncbi:MAG: hypothetical protein ABS81_08135 [Pseudonocardia sp. SCN 72-86]|nr:MAG: hypothetical protein ABS81_08135 [Pseudonocardia sp. SCN 72-86]